MIQSFRQYLLETYITNQFPYTHKIYNKPFIQIDDQDDKDNINEFVNIFIIPKRRYNFVLEICGLIPITQEMADLAEIYQGKANFNLNKITLTLHPKIIDVVIDLAGLIRKSSSMGDTVGNSHWKEISGRTISSLYRFVRIVKDYVSLKESQLI
ncbi:MAG: hypothetical protein PVI26_07830 [Chitinispirillia bacterium]|jgi:hypothetical protein